MDISERNDRSFKYPEAIISAKETKHKLVARIAHAPPALEKLKTIWKESDTL